MMTAARIHPNGRINFVPTRQRGYWWLTRSGMRQLLGRVPRKPTNVWLVETPQGSFDVQLISQDRIMVTRLDSAMILVTGCRGGFERRMGITGRPDGLYPFRFEVLSR